MCIYIYIYMYVYICIYILYNDSSVVSSIKKSARCPLASEQSSIMRNMNQ